jgi:hypothetical protein
VQHSFAHRSPPRRPYSNVKSMVLVVQFGATAVGGTRQEEKAQRAVAASSESKPWIAPPLPHNEMLARTYSASNFGSITPLANQMTALNQSANSECLNSWVLFGAHRSPSRAPRRQHRLALTQARRPQPAKCEVAHTSPSVSALKVPLATSVCCQEGNRWHRNQIGSHLS